MSKYESYDDYLEKHLEKQDVISAKEKLLIEDAFLAGWVAQLDWFRQFDDMEKEAQESFEVAMITECDCSGCGRRLKPRRLKPRTWSLWAWCKFWFLRRYWS